eukprot:7986732-Pyramimonas_sp.AAC.1
MDEPITANSQRTTKVPSPAKPVKASRQRRIDGRNADDRTAHTAPCRWLLSVYYRASTVTAQFKGHIIVPRIYVCYHTSKDIRLLPHFKGYVVVPRIYVCYHTSKDTRLLPHFKG